MAAPLSHIKSLKDLKQEQYRVQERIKLHEKEFTKKVQQLPGELAAAGVNNIIPPFLRGKVTNSALSGGKFLINKLFVSGDSGEPGLVTTTKKSAIAPIIKTVFNLLKGRK